MKTRRAFLLSLPFVGLFTKASASEAPRGPRLPHALVDRYGLRPVRGRMTLASSVVIVGEDGNAYSLLDLLAALHWQRRKR